MQRCARGGNDGRFAKHARMVYRSVAMATSALVAIFFLTLQQLIHLGRADEIVFRQSSHGMGAEFHAAFVVADFHVGMMVFFVGDVGDGVDEGHRLVKVFEFELARDGTIAQGPAVDGLEECGDLR